MTPCTCAGVGSPSLAGKYDPQVLNHPRHFQMIALGIIKSGEGPSTPDQVCFTVAIRLR